MCVFVAKARDVWSNVMCKSDQYINEAIIKHRETTSTQYRVARFHSSMSHKTASNSSLCFNQQCVNKKSFILQPTLQHGDLSASDLDNDKFPYWNTSSVSVTLQWTILSYLDHSPWLQNRRISEYMTSSHEQSTHALRSSLHCLPSAPACVRRTGKIQVWCRHQKTPVGTVSRKWNVITALSGNSFVTHC